MPEQSVEDGKMPVPDNEETKEGRRRILGKLGRFAAITPPAIVLLLAAAAKPAKAVLYPVL